MIAGFPSRSVILAICYQWVYDSSAKQQSGGADMTDSEGFNMMKTKHDNFSIHDCGLFIHPQYPYLGSTSNAIISIAVFFI